DVVGAQPPQAPFDGLAHALAVVATAVRIALPDAQGVLGGDHEPLALRGDQAADDLLALPIGVTVGRVDEVSTGAGLDVEELAALLLGGAPAPALAESHRAQAEFRNPQPRPAPKLVSHRALLLLAESTLVPEYCPHNARTSTSYDL